MIITNDFDSILFNQTNLANDPTISIDSKDLHKSLNKITPKVQQFAKAILNTPSGNFSNADIGKLETFRNLLENINTKAEKHNSKLLVQFLSVFNHNYKCPLLEDEIKSLDKKIASIRYAINTSKSNLEFPIQTTQRVMDFLSARLANEKGQAPVREAIFRTSASEEVANDVLGELKINSKLILTKYPSEHLAIVAKRLTTALPTENRKNFEKIGLINLDLSQKLKEDGIALAKERINQLDPENKRFLQSMITMLKAGFECDWEKRPDFQSKDDALDAMFFAARFGDGIIDKPLTLKNAKENPCPNCKFLILHYDAIFGQNNQKADAAG